MVKLLATLIAHERAAKEEKSDILSLVSELTFTDRKTERLMKQILTYLIRKA